MSPRVVIFSRQRQTGFTLLEALVTIVVISIGLLGILGLQTVSLSNTQVSSSRSAATFAADDMADRIRANRAGAWAGDYNGIDHPSAGAPPSPNCADADCSPAQMAAFDAWQWDQRLRGEPGAERPGTLPRGRGRIDCIENANVDGNTGTECASYRITVLWLERDPDQSVAPAEPTLAQCNGGGLRSGCFQTVVRP